ncbi:MAG TPA: hypothetical protein VH438_08490 [Gemmatimonadales bacterium]|jgi:hypothetical protein
MNLNQVKLLAVIVGPAADSTVGQGPVVNFEYEDLDQTVRQLRAMGIDFARLPIDQPWLWREAQVKGESRE